MKHTSSDVASNLLRVRESIAASARNARDITLVAVSKTHPAGVIAEAIAAGHRHFGENRVQEASEKWPALKAQTPDLVLHLIGPLQTNKVAEAVALFDVIHTVDRPKLAEKLAAAMTEQKRNLPCFIQVNTGREPQKAGIDAPDLGAFLAYCRQTCRLNIVGLMCIPPVDEEPALHFAFLRELARRHGLTQLSMGMSSDAEVAVAFGATHVRIGSAIFGERHAEKDHAAGG